MSNRALAMITAAVAVFAGVALWRIVMSAADSASLLTPNGDEALLEALLDNDTARAKTKNESGWGNASPVRRYQRLSQPPMQVSDQAGETKPTPTVRETMDALKGTVAATSRYLPNPYVDLSGGRDSRLVTATFVDCGLPFRSNTNDRKPGEVEVAQHLLAQLSNAPAHRLQHIVNDSDGLGHLAAFEHAHAWHNCCSVQTH